MTRANPPEPTEPNPDRKRAQGDLTINGRAYRRGEGTFEQLHSKLEPFLRQEFRKRRPLPKGVTADDLVQMTLLRIWKSFDQFRDDDTTSLSKWATTIAASVCAEVGRKKIPAQMPESGSDERDPGAGPVTEVVRRDFAEQIENCFEAMTVEQELVFRMHVLDEIPLNKIAAQLGEPEGTVRARFFRGKEKLAHAVNRLGDPPSRY